MPIVAVVSIITFLVSWFLVVVIPNEEAKKKELTEEYFQDARAYDTCSTKVYKSMEAEWEKELHFPMSDEQAEVRNDERHMAVLRETQDQCGDEPEPPYDDVVPYR